MKAIPEFTGDELTVTRKNWLQYINVYFTLAVLPIRTPIFPTHFALLISLVIGYGSAFWEQYCLRFLP
jgi:hypothetical protein